MNCAKLLILERRESAVTLITTGKQKKKNEHFTKVHKNCMKIAHNILEIADFSA